jgi:endonuclease/exonuclease/phosphatase family metal-dependent hydrolase
LVESGQYWLSETPDEPSFSWDASYPRIYAYALLRDKKTDKTIRVGTTHLELNIEALGKQRKMVVDYTAQSQEPAIVCGDFNFYALSKLYLYCINNLNDCRTLCPTATTTASYNGYNLATEKVLDADGNVKDGYGYPIDQIFVKRNAFTVHSYDVLNYLIDGKFSSDHFPVVVELSLN